MRYAGDGVNDAPSLKKADIGIAVQGATDAARAAADIVLTEPGLSVIIDAIRYSRKIFHRMKNYVTYRIACTLQLLVFFFIAILFMHPQDYHNYPTGTTFPKCWPNCHKFPNGTMPEPILPLDPMTHVKETVPEYFTLPVIALVVITILNDGTIITIARDKVIPGSTPEKWMLPHVVAVAFLLGMIACASSLLILWQSFCSAEDNTLDLSHCAKGHNTIFQGWFGVELEGLSIEQTRTIMYLKISLSDFMTVFSARTRGPFFERRPGYGLLTAFWTATITSTFLSVYAPWSTEGKDQQANIGWDVAGVIWLYCFIWFLIGDFFKWMLNKVLFSFFIKPDIADPISERQVFAQRRHLLDQEKHGQHHRLPSTAADYTHPKSIDEVVGRMATLQDGITSMQAELERLRKAVMRASNESGSRNVSRDNSLRDLRNDIESKKRH